MQKMRGLVFSGSRKLCVVQPAEDKKTIVCRIKGSVLKGSETYSQPLVPGDRVVFEPDSDGGGLVLAVEPRLNVFARGKSLEGGQNRNSKPQLIAANIDLLLCISSPDEPPFRPRFIDRILVQSEAAGIDAAIIMNKSDLKLPEAVAERLQDFARMGYAVLAVSARTGTGMEALRELIQNKVSIMTGQSGVGKSSLINALAGLQIRTGPINAKFKRGTHTTTLASLIPLPDRGFVIDTPGVRLFSQDGVSASDLILLMRDLAPFAGTCSFGVSCSHTVEPGCKIREALENGCIHPDRYESFLRIREEIEK